MLLVGCSGFPVPATRYLREFPLVEISDTFLGVPGPALVRRWRREAPEGFLFTALAPRELTADSFKPTGAADAAWDAFLPVLRDLDSRALVVTTPPEVVSSKMTRASARNMFERLLSEDLPPVIFEPPPSWDIKEAESTVKDLGIVVARDPTRHPAYARGKLGYYRLPGPAGHKSRYEDAAIDNAAKTVRETRLEEIYVIFGNVDMYADSKRLKKLLEG